MLHASVFENYQTFLYGMHGFWGSWWSFNTGTANSRPQLNKDRPSKEPPLLVWPPGPSLKLEGKFMREATPAKRRRYHGITFKRYVKSIVVVKGQTSMWHAAQKETRRNFWIIQWWVTDLPWRQVSFRLIWTNLSNWTQFRCATMKTAMKLDHLITSFFHLWIMDHISIARPAVHRPFYPVSGWPTVGRAFPFFNELLRPAKSWLYKSMVSWWWSCFIVSENLGNLPMKWKTLHYMKICMQ